MARLFWVGVGAVSGIYVYRKGEQIAGAVREQGVAGTAQAVATFALQAVSAPPGSDGGGAVAVAAERPQLRIGGILITRTDRPNAAAAAPAAIMDTAVVDLTGAGRPARVRRRKAD